MRRWKERPCCLALAGYEPREYQGGPCVGKDCCARAEMHLRSVISHLPVTEVGEAQQRHEFVGPPNDAGVGTSDADAIPFTPCHGGSFLSLGGAHLAQKGIVAAIKRLRHSEAL